MYDVAVVGAGPAGSAAALSVLQQRPDAKVLLLDRAAFPRDKPCGDGVAPHAVRELRTLGVLDVLDGRTSVDRLRMVSPRGVEAATTTPEATWVVPRTVFDARLVDAAVARGAELRQHTVRTLELHPGRVRVDDVEARVVIGADGAHGTVRKLLGLPRQPDHANALAVRGYATAPAGPAEQLVRMDARDWPAYAWSFDAGDGTVNVGYGMLVSSLRAAGGKAALHARLEELLPGTTAERLRSHHLPLSTYRPQQPAGRVLLVGDAASLVNPLTGEGIFYALLSGRLAGNACAADDPGSSYGRALQDSLGRHLRHTTLMARATRHPRVLEGGIRAAARSDAALQALADLGLGDGLISRPLLAAAGRELWAKVSSPSR